MATCTDHTARTVIPKWKEYKDFASSGELMGGVIAANQVSYFSIREYVERWRKSPSMATAGDLLSAAIMNGQTELPEVISAAKYVVEREDYGYLTLCKTAQMLIPTEEDNSRIQHKSKISTKIGDLNIEHVYKERVSFLRKLINEYPYNPLWYVELAHSYVNIGLDDKAKKCMKIAVHLAPNSRYVSRCAARLFLHCGDVDDAHHVLTDNGAFINDPWLIASEIAVNAAKNRGSRFIKRGLALINSGNYSPFALTELTSAIGTIELESSFKKGRTLLNQSLIAPNDNSWAQAEWLLDRDKSLGLNIRREQALMMSSEGQAIAAFSNQQYEVALDNAIDWISEIRFAKRPIYFAADMAYLYQERYEDAINILQFGFKMHPQEFDFKNNLAYAYALNNQLSEAERELNELRMILPFGSTLNICATATEGLIEFRKGNSEQGRRLYTAAIDAAQSIRFKQLADKARLNLIREEVIANPKCDKTILEPLDKLNTGDDRETEAMKKTILQSIHE